VRSKYSAEERLSDTSYGLDLGIYDMLLRERAHVFMIWVVTLWRAGIRLRAMLSSAIVNVVVKTRTRTSM